MLKKQFSKEISFSEPGKSDNDSNSLGSSVGEKIFAGDVVDVQGSAMTLRGKKNEYEDITDDLLDKSSNTSQYVKLVNAYIIGKKSQIEKIIELKNNFDQEIQNLKSDNNKFEQLSGIPIHEFNLENLNNVTQNLLKNREFRRQRLENLKNEIIRVEKNLVQSEKKIEVLNKQILFKKIKHNVNKKKKNVQMITELSELLDKYDPKELSETFRELSGFK